MRFDNAVLLVIISTIALYTIFLFVPDFNLIQEKISNFKINYLPLIFVIVSASWIPIILKWQFLLRTCGIEIPLTKSIAVFLSGMFFEVTPGKIGGLMKSQILKTSSNIPRTKTAPIVLVEKVYDFIGAIVASIIGIIILGMEPYLIIIGILVLSAIFFFMYYGPASELFFNRITKTKFFSKYAKNMSEFHQTIQKSTNVKIATICILLAVAYWFIVSSAVYYVLIGFDIDALNYLKVLAIYATSTLLGALSFIPGGIGVTEGTLTGLLTLEGIDVSTALILSVMIRLLTLWYSAFIGFIALKFTGAFSFLLRTDPD